MAGFVIDIIVGFFIRWVIMYWREAVSRKWPTVAGTVVGCQFEKRFYGGDYVVLRYKYKMNWERFQGEIKKPYFYPNYAEAFVRHHPADSELRVRVNPENPTKSFPVLA